MRKYLKALRKNIGLSQQDVAEKLSISRQYYCSIENGSRQKDLDTSLVIKLSTLFSISAEEILKQEQLLT